MYILTIILPIKNLQKLLYKSKSIHNIYVGCRILVPIKKRYITGIIIKIQFLNKNTRKVNFKKIKKILDYYPIINKNLIILLKKISQYNSYPICKMLLNIIPKNIQKKKIITNIKKKQKKKHTPLIINENNFFKRINIYIKIIKKFISNKCQILFLTTKLYLTKEIFKILNKKIKIKIEILHSKIKNKIQIWNNILKNKTSIIIGTRSAIFTPFYKLGLIIIDDEHSEYYKENKQWTYNSRNIGILRAKIEKSLIILGSCAPSIKSFYNFQIGKYKQLNKINIKDKKNKISIIKKKIDISNTLLKKIKDNLKKNNKIIFILNNNYIYLIKCKKCQWKPKCNICNKYYIKNKKNIICNICCVIKKNYKFCIKCNSLMEKENLNMHLIYKKITKILPKIKIFKINNIIKKNTDKINIIIISDIKLILFNKFNNIKLIILHNNDNILSTNNYKIIENYIHNMINYIEEIKGLLKNNEIIILTKYPKNNLLNNISKYTYEILIKKIIKERKIINFPPFTKEIIITYINKTKNNIIIFLKEIRKITLQWFQKKKINFQILNLIKFIKNKNLYSGKIFLHNRSKKNILKFIKYIKYKIKKKYNYKINTDFI